MSAIKIPVERIKTNPFCKRDDLGSLDGLEQSIRKYGMLLPLVGREEEGKIELAFGKRRFAALKRAGAEEVEVIVRKLSDEDMAMLALIENVHRKNLNPVELAQAYQVGLRVARTTIDDFANQIGVPKTEVYDHLKLLKLPESVKAKADKWGYGRLLAFATAAEHASSEGTASFESRIDERDMDVQALTHLASALNKVYLSQVSLKIKDGLANQLIWGDYRFLKRNEYHLIVERAEKLVNDRIVDITKRGKEPRQQKPRNPQHLPEIASGPHTDVPLQDIENVVKQAIQDDRRLRGAIQKCREFSNYLTKLNQHLSYENTLPQIRKEFTTYAGKIVQAIKDIIGNA